MLEISLLRHGQTDFSRENRFCGSIDPPLNDVGLRMAQAVGDGWKDHGFTAIWCSPATRTRQTAGPLAAATGLELHVDEGLREIDYGDWESLRHEDAKERWPDAYNFWAADPASRGTPGGETAFHVAARSAPVIERIRVAHPEGRVLVVSHKATLRVLMCALLGLDVRLFRERLGQPVASLSRFELTKTGARLVMLGNVSHLPPDLRDIEGT